MIDYSEIIHPARINILKAISEESKSLKDIATLLKISRPEVSRHLTTLRNQDLVKKNASVNSITTLGSLILRILDPLDFILAHYDFFKDHQLLNFPSEYLLGLNKLIKSQYIVGTGFVFQKVIEVAKYAPKTMKLLINSPIPNVSGVRYKLGYIVVPNSATEELNNPERLSQDFMHYEFRKYPEVNHSIFIIGDQYGFLKFANKEGMPDNNSCFYVEDKEGMAFLLDLWDYYWTNSTFFFQNEK